MIAGDQIGGKELTQLQAMRLFSEVFPQFCVDIM
jgi:hypothetical protein